MNRIDVSVDLPHPPDVVWDAVSQLDRHAEWMTDAESIEFQDGQTSGVGTTMDVRTRVGPFTTVDRIIVRDWAPPSTIGVTHHGIVSGTGEFRLAKTSTGTRFTWSEELRFPWYVGGPITGAFAAPILRRIWRSNLARFAATLDKPSTEPAS